jgi:euchromatic histone-lysine N-methyltransferase
MSGIYEDDLDKADEIIYTGQGGNDLLGNHRQIGSQKLARGNLALKASYTGSCLLIVLGIIFDICHGQSLQISSSFRLSVII